MLKGGWLVCDRCAAEYAPELVAEQKSKFGEYENGIKLEYEKAMGLGESQLGEVK